MARKTQTIEQLDASIKRWKTRLKRAMTMVEKLEKQKRRIEAKALVASTLDPVLEQLGALSIRPKASNFDYLRKGMAPRKEEKVVVFEPDQVAGFHPDQSIAERVSRGGLPPEVAPIRPAQTDLDIPEFLRRGQAAQKAADAVIEEIKAEQAATKKAKAAGRIAKMKAKKAGDLKKMPLSGKAALAAIRGE